MHLLARYPPAGALSSGIPSPAAVLASQSKQSGTLAQLSSVTLRRIRCTAMAPVLDDLPNWGTLPDLPLCKPVPNLLQHL